MPVVGHHWRAVDRHDGGIASDGVAGRETVADRDTGYASRRNGVGTDVPVNHRPEQRLVVIDRVDAGDRECRGMCD